jgi:hypothetical protein
VTGNTLQLLCPVSEFMTLVGTGAGHEGIAVVPGAESVLPKASYAEVMPV